MPCQDIVFSFDTTGSMYPCLSQVKNKVGEIINKLFDSIPSIKIGVIAHGDYCDKNSSYLMKFEDITNDRNKLINFVQNVSSTGGGDYPEAYEYVLRESQKLSWNSESVRILVMIGDATPHGPDDNPEKIDWRHESKELKNMGVNIYSVQCLDSGNKAARTFYKQMAEITGGYHLYLDQFSYITEMMLAICFRQLGEENLTNYQQEVTDRLGGLTNNLRQMFDLMLGKTTTSEIEEENNARYAWGDSDLPSRTSSRKKKTETVDFTTLDDSAFVMKPCVPSRFQIMDVASDTDIKSFVASQGVTFAKGRGFYEFTKPETITKKKEIILQKKTTGELFEGLYARKLMNLIDYDEDKKIKCGDYPEYRVFIQSTSVNRKLIGDTKFLYEVDGFAATS